ncbi:FAS1 domain-containing protein [Flammula alnicola]|nr:FAS1 domain-containing protein [Flammula alnicola]
MRFKCLWLFPLGSSLALHLGLHGELHTTDNEISATRFYAQEEQQPIFPGKPHHPHDTEPPSSTIYEVLANDSRFSLVTKALNFVEDVATLLNDSSAHLTFFAPPDRVLRRPPGSPPHRNLSSIDSFVGNSNVDESVFLTEFRDLTEALGLLDELDLTNSASLGSLDDEKRKKILKIILRAILSYHILPTAAYDIVDFGNNITYPTKLSISGALDGQPLRLRVTQTVIPPATTINFFTRIIHHDVKATNGIIHVVSHALLPPPSVFQELYLAPRFFSILTSALQRSDLTGDVDLRFIHGKGLKGTSLVTVFAPTNRAFVALPKKLQLFLFSPFGERVLKKLLQYHIVPAAVVHSNYIHGNVVAETSNAPQISDENYAPEHDHPIPPSHAEPILSVNVTLQTLFENRTLNAHIVQKKFTFPTFPGHKHPYIIDTKVFVNHQLVKVPDIVSLNGAIHVVDRLLDPRSHHHAPHGGHEQRPPHHGPKHGPEDGPKHEPCSLHHDSKRGRPEGRLERTPGAQHRGPKHGSRHGHERGPSNDGGHHDFYDQEDIQDNDEYDPWVHWESWLPQWAEETD